MKGLLCARNQVQPEATEQNRRHILGLTEFTATVISLIRPVRSVTQNAEADPGTTEQVTFSLDLKLRLASEGGRGEFQAEGIACGIS